MSRFTITLSTLLILFANSINAIKVSDIPSRKLDRDEWWNALTYDDHPRVFNWKQDTPCPAIFFYLDCNSCRCIRGSMAGCTRMGCDVPQILNYSNGMECPAGNPFYSKCNDCTCHEDGKSATCTNKKCPDAEKKNDNV